MNESQLKSITRKPGYGVSGGIVSGIKSSFREKSIDSSIERSRKEHDVEPDSGDASLQAEKLQINYSGKVRIRITFYRRRLADYSRAISEKALLDCCVYAGLISGDSEKEIWLEDGGQKKVETNEEERTELEFFYEEVDLDNLWIKAKQNYAR